MKSDPFKLIHRFKTMKRKKTKSQISNCIHGTREVLCIIILVVISVCIYYLYHKESSSKDDVYYPSLTNTMYFKEKGENIYPTSTFCFGNPFLVTESKLKEYNLAMTPNIFLSIYPKFLSGIYWDRIKEKFGDKTLETFKQISYDDVTTDLTSHVVGQYLKSYLFISRVYTTTILLINIYTFNFTLLIFVG